MEAMPRTQEEGPQEDLLKQLLKAQEATNDFLQELVDLGKGQQRDLRALTDALHLLRGNLNSLR